MVLRRYDVLIKCRLGMERVCASYIKDLNPKLEVVSAPKGFSGLVLVGGADDKYELARLIKERVPEADKVLIIDGVAKAEIPSIAEEVTKIIKDKISPDETFAVRTVRRGSHEFTSIDVNVAVGAKVKEVTGASVNLEFPDKVVAVEIIGGDAYISIIDGKELWRKKGPTKRPMYRLFRRFSIIHEPYLGPLDACRTMGIRIGREAQTFEVDELIIAPKGPVKALELKTFIEGVLEGIETRYQVQVKAYGRDVHKVRVYVQDMYQVVRDRSNEVLIVLEPEGKPVSQCIDELEELILRRRKRINLFIGAREGVPLGIYRFANLVLDIAPGITIATDYALSSALIAIATLIHDKFSEEW